MLRISKVKITLQTEDGAFGFEAPFTSGLNLIASDDNTCGKSSVIAAIYYCLGMEEIIGGRGGKVLPSAYKTALQYNEKNIKVLESSALLEINNGVRSVTIFRTIKSLSERQDMLITVYESDLDSIFDPETKADDYYVHLPNSAVNEKGFFTFLEEFLHLDLPTVPTVEGTERKLYLQLIFSAMFIEQKQGWGNVLARMPNFGVREARKRVIEFIIHLDVLKNEKLRESSKLKESSIRSKWQQCLNEVTWATEKQFLSFHGIPLSPRIMERKEIDAINVIQSSNDKSINDLMHDLESEHEKLQQREPIVDTNYDDLQIELEKIDTDVRALMKEIRDKGDALAHEKAIVSKHKNDLEVIRNDLRNNQDAARLKNLGSQLQGNTFADICPVCHQSVQDSLLAASNFSGIMTIDENIAHLKAQENMLEFSINSHSHNIATIQHQMEELTSVLFSMQRLGKSLRNDIFALGSEVSEAVVRKRIDIENRMVALQEVEKQIEKTKERLTELSTEWAAFLKERENLPRKQFSESDEKKRKDLCEYFVSYLSSYGYKSYSNIASIKLSEDTYMPMIDEFDMKFDSSASDNIRVIWAYTMALLQTSLTNQGNHPGILIFDEPDQHSIVPKDLQSFFDSIVDLGANCQVIVGITVKDIDTTTIIQEMDPQKYKRIDIKGKAFTPVAAAQDESVNPDSIPDEGHLELPVNDVNIETENTGTLGGVSTPEENSED